MLLFYENQPDAIELNRDSPHQARKCASPGSIDPLLHYDSHEFIPISRAEIANTLTADGTKSDKTFKANINILQASSWTYCGSLLQPCRETLPPSFHTWASVTLDNPHELVGRLVPVLAFVRNVLLEAGAEHYWLTIRATESTDDYDVPRWHVDDNFFSSDPEAGGLGFGSSNGARCWKLATTLLGPPTLFLKNNEHALEVLRRTKAQEHAQMGDHTCTSIRCLGCATYADTVRQSLAHSLYREAVESASYGEVAFFRIGEELGAVHSEPSCHTDRIFVNVVPGTENDLRALMTRFGIGFPRAWCVGNPVGFIPSDEKDALLAVQASS